MEDDHTRDVVALATAQVEIETKCFLQNHPRILLSRFALDTEWMSRWSCITATLLPARFFSTSIYICILVMLYLDASSFPVFSCPGSSIPTLGGFSIFYSNLMDLQVDAQIQLASEGEKDQDTGEDETRVFKFVLKCCC